MAMIERDDYVDFIVSKIPKTMNVQLYNKVLDTQTQSEVIHYGKGGLAGYEPVELTVKEIYRISVKIEIKFHTYIKEFILYTPLHCSPNDISEKLNKTVKKIVWDTFQENNEDEHVKMRKAEHTKVLFQSLKPVDIEKLRNPEGVRKPQE